MAPWCAVALLLSSGCVAESGDLAGAEPLDQRAVDDSVQLSTGAARTLRIRLDAPGTYYYWGTTMGRTVGERTKVDAQLTGAIIVDPADGPVPEDRVLLIGMWSDTAGHVPVDRNRLLAAVKWAVVAAHGATALHGGRHDSLARHQCVCRRVSIAWKRVTERSSVP